MSDDNVTLMGDYDNDGCKWTPEDVLKKALKYIQDADPKNPTVFNNPKQLVILALDDSTGDYEYEILQAQFHDVELIALLDVVKHSIIFELGM